MPELDPATLAERVLRLSRSPPFDQMTVEDVTLLAAAGRERSYPTRTLLVRAGERSVAHYVQLAGRLRLMSDQPELAAVGGLSGVGALSVLGGMTLPVDLVVDAGSVLLVLDRDALLSVLEEHGHVARSFLRLIAQKLLEARRKRGSGPPPAQPPPTTRLDLVSRMLTLREALGLGSDGMATVARLARVTKARQFEAGSLLSHGDEPADVLIPLEGSILVKGPADAERTVRPGEVLGLVEAIAGVPVHAEVTALTRGTMLVLSHHELAEDIEDEDALCLELLRNFSAQLGAVMTARRPVPETAVAQPAGG